MPIPVLTSGTSMKIDDGIDVVFRALFHESRLASGKSKVNCLLDPTCATHDIDDSVQMLQSFLLENTWIHIIFEMSVIDRQSKRASHDHEQINAENANAEVVHT